jgi:hypothetical protein
MDRIENEKIREDVTQREKGDLISLLTFLIKESGIKRAR